MFKAKTLEDFKALQSLVKDLNEQGIWKLRLDVKQEHSQCDLYVIDSTEELYYDGCLFEKTMDLLDSALKKDTVDTGAYFDCVCPGRWLADFAGRDPYTKSDIEMDIDIAIHTAMLKYMTDHDLKPNWTKELEQKLDDLPKTAVDLIMKVLN